MKTLIISTIVILFAFMQIQAQESTVPFKKCNTIEVQGGSLKEFAKYLQSEGITIENYNNDIETLRSGPFELWKASNHTGTIIAYINNNILTVTGEAMVESFGSKVVDKIEQRGTGNMNGKAFYIINELVVKYAQKHNYPLNYQKL